MLDTKTALLAKEIAAQLAHTEVGHCARVDYLTGPESEKICNYLKTDPPVEKLLIHILTPGNQARPAPGSLLLTADQAIEIRNRKEQRLLLFIPADLVDTKASSLTNSFALIDGRHLNKLALDKVKASLSQENQRLLKQVFDHSRPPLRVSAGQQLDFACLLHDAAQNGGTINLGQELWRLNLICDARPDFTQDLAKNRDCVIKLAYPTRVAAALGERLQSLRVSPETFNRLNNFFRSRTLFDVSRWSRELLETGLTFDRWTFPGTHPSDLQEVTPRSFLKKDGSVETFCKLKQPDGPRGPLLAECNDKSFMVVKWKTEPENPLNLGRWKIEMIPNHHEYADLDVELPAVEVDAARREARLKLDLNLEEQAIDFSVCVRITPLDAAGNEIEQASEGSRPAADAESLAALTQDFFLVRQEVDGGSTGRTGPSQRTVPTIASGRLEAILDSPAPGEVKIAESEPQWSQKDLLYFSLKLTDRRIIHLGFSPVLRDLEHDTLQKSSIGGRYKLVLAEPKLLEFKDFEPHQVSQKGHPATWKTFMEKRGHLFHHLSSDQTRGFIAAADWTNKSLNYAVEEYVRSYLSLLQALSEKADKAALLEALTLDTLLVKVNNQHGQANEAVITLPTHPLRLAWFLDYNRLLAGWETQLKGLSQRERKAALDKEVLDWLTPLNFPAFAFSFETGQPFLFFQNLRFFYGVALPASNPNPQRQFEDIASLFGIKPDARVGSLSPSTLTNYLTRYLKSHPHLKTLVVNLVNPAQGDFFVEAARGLISNRNADEETENEFPVFQLTSYVTENRLSSLSNLQQLRQLQAEELRSSQTDAFLPGLTNVVRDFKELHEGRLTDAHLTFMSDLVIPEISTVPLAPTSISPEPSSLKGLVNRFSADLTYQDQNLCWHYSLDITSQGSTLLASLNRLLLEIGGLLLSGQPAHQPALEVTLSHQQLELLDNLHTHSDWVVTADRFFGLDYYDSPSNAHTSSNSQKYVLDYSPEFLEGVGHRLMVTTTWRGELSALLKRAMHDLGFIEVDQSLSRLLHYLKTVSGRLLFQTPETTTQSSAAVGLGVVTAWLESQGLLQNAVLIPVDAHQRLFSTRDSERQSANGRRCDLILVGFRENKLDCTFIEVKWRRSQVILEELALDMEIQMRNSAESFAARFLDHRRVDARLQRTYLAEVLHFYLDRAVRYQLLTPAARKDFLNNLKRLETLEQDDIACVPNLEGYIVSLNEPPRDSVIIGQAVINFLTAQDFESTSLAGSIMSLHPGGISSSETLTILPNEHVEVTSEPQLEKSAVADSGQPEQTTPEIFPDHTVAGPLEIAEQKVVLPDESTSFPAPDQAKSPTSEIELALGEVSGKPVIWKPSVKGSPHLFIIGIPGQGKSWAVTRILTEFGKQNVPTLVLDFHGQFSDAESSFSQKVKPTVIDAAAGLPFSPFEFSETIGTQGWKAASISIAEIFAYVADLGDIQRDTLYTSILEAYQARGFNNPTQGHSKLQLPDLPDVLRRLERKEREGKGVHVIARCRPLLEMDLFRPEPSGKNFLSTIKEGLVVDLHNLQYAETLQLAAGAFILRKIYTDMLSWKQADKLRLAIVLDEAHKLAKDVTLPKIMKEGRKFGIAIIVASQGLSDFHQDVLGNAGTKVIFRVNYPESRRVANYIRSAKGQDLADNIEQLNVGVAYVQTPDMQYGSQVKMYPLDKG